MSTPDYQHLLENRMTDIETVMEMVNVRIDTYQKAEDHTWDVLKRTRLFFAVSMLVLCVAFIVFGLHQMNRMHKLEGEIWHFHNVEEVTYKDHEKLQTVDAVTEWHGRRLNSIERKLRQHGIGEVRTGELPKEDK